jgi:N-acetylneuraminic acid mutarotase
MQRTVAERIALVLILGGLLNGGRHAATEWNTGVPEAAANEVDGTLNGNMERAMRLGAGGHCSEEPDGTWSGISGDGAPAPRRDPTAVWTGQEMIVWGGGGRGDGGRYDPQASTWQPVALERAPTGRSRHSAVWTGQEMIVWGGSRSSIDGSIYLGDGASYDPVTDTWASVTADGAPSPRAGHIAVWTGEEMLIWGGDADGALLDGARYNPETDIWTPLPPADGNAGGGTSMKGVVSGTQFLVFGGIRGALPGSGFVLGARWDPISDAWSAVSTAGAITDRPPRLLVWTGDRILAWYSEEFPGSGRWFRAYDPVMDRWKTLSVEGAIGSRSNATAVWTGREMVILGGSVSDRSALGGIRILGDAGAYDPASDTWRRFPGLMMSGFTAVWAESEILTFGGAGGARYLPPCELSVRREVLSFRKPGGRGGDEGQAAIARGSVGRRAGCSESPDGMWFEMSDAGAPSPRTEHSAIWTGREMLIWGGGGRADGSRYDPKSDTWRSMALEGAPSGREGHSAVWTGQEMIVWGGGLSQLDGSRFFGDGGRYDPRACSGLALAYDS